MTREAPEHRTWPLASSLTFVLAPAVAPPTPGPSWAWALDNKPFQNPYERLSPTPNLVGLLRGVPRAATIVALLAMAGAAFAACALIAPDALGSPLPPTSGDWTIDTGETVECAFIGLDVRGSVIVLGDLALDNCTLVLFSETSGPDAVEVRAGGSLVCTSTRIMPSQADRPFVLVAEAGSTLSMTGGSVSDAGTSISDGGPGSGIYVATDATLDGVLVQRCLGGLWASGGSVAVRGCTFVGCGRAVVSADDARLTMDGCDLVGCAVGAMVRSAALTVRGGSFSACPQAVLSIDGELAVEDASFEAFDQFGVEAYVSTVSVLRCRFEDALGEAVFAAYSDLSVLGCTFLRCWIDVDCVEANATVSGTSHRLTTEEALYLRWSTFSVDNVSCNASSWGVRSYLSTGSMRDISCVDTIFPVYVDCCPLAALDRVRIAYTLPDANRTDPRGLMVVGSRVDARHLTVTGVRTAISFDGGSGVVDGLEATHLTRAGVVLGMVSDLAVRNATVEDAIDGFLVNSWCHVLLEDCKALRCRATGYNMTFGGWPVLARCNASGCPVGVRTDGTYPTLVDCELHMRDASGRDILGSVGLDCHLGSPRVTGGSVIGGETGMAFNGSASLVRNVTFLGTRGQCLLFTCSTGDSVEGCMLLGTNGSTGAVIVDSSPALRGNVVRGTKYGFMALFNLSRAVFERNTIEDIVFDGIVVVAGAQANLAGNTVRRCGGSALIVALFSRASGDGEVLSSTGSNLVHVFTGSSLELRRSTLSNASTGVRGYDAISLNFSFCRFIDLGKGVVAERLAIPDSTAPSLDVTVEGCYFTNNSAYGVGVVNGHLRVLRCTFLLNGAGACAWNSTVELLDCTMVLNYVNGLMTENSTAKWTVTGLCRVVGSPIRSPVALTVRGGELDLEDSLVALGSGGGLWASDGASLRVSRCSWYALGTPFWASCSTVVLYEVGFNGVGNLDGGAGRRAGVVIEGSDLVATGVTFTNARGGLRLIGCDATLSMCAATDCLEWGLYASASSVSATSCLFERIGTGADVEMDGSSLEADNCTLGPSVNGLSVTDGTAMLVDCALGGAARASVLVVRGRVVLVNTSHEVDRLSPGEGGLIEVWWRVTCTVGWGNPDEVPSVEVRVEDSSARAVASSRPDAGGTTPAMLVLALERLPEGVVDHGPHTVLATLHGYGASRTVTLDRSMTVGLRLEDTEAPTIVVVLPGTGEVLSSSRSIELVAHAEDLGSGVATIEVLVDNATSPWVSQGDTVARTLLLVDGHHVVLLTARDRAGNAASRSLSVWVEGRPVKLLASEPPDGLSTSARTVVVKGYVSRTGVTVKVGDALAQVNGTAFMLEVELAEGANRIVVTAEDPYGHRAVANLTVHADRTAPELLLTSDRLIYTEDESVLVEGVVGEGAMLTLNGMPVIVAPGPFKLRVPVIMGENGVSVRAVDDIGNERAERVVVIRSEAEVVPQGYDWWEAVPFVVVVPLLAVAVWYVVLGRRLGGDAR